MSENTPQPEQTTSSALTQHMQTAVESKPDTVETPVAEPTTTEVDLSAPTPEAVAETPVKEEAPVAAAPVVEPSGISDTFDSIAENQAIAEQPAEFDFSEVSIDVGQVTISESNPIDLSNAVDDVLNQRASYAVVCMQSSYSANMGSIRMEDKARIVSSTSSAYESKMRLYRTIYDKVQTMNCPKPSFKEWCKMTAYNDIDTLVFGMYAQTYPGDSDFDVTCAKCSHEMKSKVGVNSMLQVKDEAAYAKVQEVIQNTGDIEAVQQSSMLNAVERTVMDRSKIIAELRTPSIQDHLDILSSFGSELKGDTSEIIGFLMFVKRILVPDIKHYERTRQLRYLPVVNQDEMLSVIRRLNTEDGAQLDKVITERATKFQIDYQIPTFNCPNCQTQVGPIPVDMENLLFTKVTGRI